MVSIGLGQNRIFGVLSMSADCVYSVDDGQKMKFTVICTNVSGGLVGVLPDNG